MSQYTSRLLDEDPYFNAGKRGPIQGEKSRNQMHKLISIEDQFERRWDKAVEANSNYFRSSAGKVIERLYDTMQRSGHELDVADLTKELKIIAKNRAEVLESSLNHIINEFMSKLR